MSRKEILKGLIELFKKDLEPLTTIQLKFILDIKKGCK